MSAEYVYDVVRHYNFRTLRRPAMSIRPAAVSLRDERSAPTAKHMRATALVATRRQSRRFRFIAVLTPVPRTACVKGGKTKWHVTV